MAFSRNSFRLSFLAAVGAAVVLLAFGASSAFASCSYATSGQTFSQWNDFATYVPAVGGTLEDGVDGWSLSNAGVVKANESFFLNDSSDKHSLAIADGGSATSPASCVNRNYPTLRFMARNTGSRWAVLRVDVIYLDGAGGAKTMTAGFATAGPNWTPSPIQVMVLGQLIKTDGDQSVRFRFTPVGDDDSAFQIDDIYIDPWARY
jgi:hypothetical protein